MEGELFLVVPDSVLDPELGRTFTVQSSEVEEKLLRKVDVGTKTSAVDLAFET